MGTRGLTGFVIENQVKASYQQYDSYPSGVGLDVLAFAKKLADGLPDALIDLRKKVAKITLVPETENPTPVQVEALVAAGYEAQGVSTGRDWYAWLREDQGNPERISNAPFMLDSAAFATDSLFCEWAYLINTDEQTLEVYQGFQDKPHADGRFAEQFTPADHRSHQYYPVRLVQTYRFSALPSPEKFQKDLGE